MASTAPVAPLTVESSMTFDELRLLVKGVVKELAETRAELSSSQRDLASMKTTLASTKSSLKATKKNLNSATSRLATAEKALTATNARLTATEEELAATKTRLTTTETKLAEESAQREKADIALLGPSAVWTLAPQLSRCVAPLSCPHAVYCVKVLSGGRIASGGPNFLSVWTKGAPDTLPVSGDVMALAESSDGKLIAAVDSVVVLYTFGGPYGARAVTLGRHTDTIFCLKVYGTQLVSGSKDTTIKVWLTATGKCLRTLSGHSKPVYCLSQLADYPLVSGSADGTIKFWKDGKCESTLTTSAGITALVALPGGRLVSGDSGGAVKVWKDGECVQTLEGHSSTVWSIVPFPGDTLASVSADKTVKVWRLSDGACTATLEGHTSNGRCMAKLPSDHLVSGSFDKTLRVWGNSKPW